MNIFFALAVFYGSVGHLCATIPLATIASDTAELMKLSRDSKSMLPPIAYHMVNATCQMVSQCCPELRSKFMSIAMSGKSDTLTEQCFGKRNSVGFRLRLRFCSPIATMATLALDPQLIKYVIISKDKLLDDKELMKLMSQGCSSEELMLIACKWDNYNETEETCQRKILEKLAEQGDDKVYTDKVAYMKLKTKEYNDEVKKTFSV